MLRPFLILLSLLAHTSTQAQLPVRVENMSLQMPSEVFSSVAYEVENANFGDIGYAVAFATPPGETNRIFIADRLGTVRVIPDLSNPVPEIFLDLNSRVENGFSEEGLLGLAFHPNYASNGYFYVYYTEVPGTNGFVHYDTISRFNVTATNANRALASSELQLIRQEDDPWGRNHNGGELQFGPDGYLYISVGDGGNRGRTQRINQDFYSGILRIDVDLKPGNLPPNMHPASVGPYAIPNDNPWLGASNFNGSAVMPSDVRTEFFAVGLRNPWRMSIDQFTGDILLGDVGEGSYEEVNYIVSKGNYGWPFREGPDAFEGTPPAAALPFVDPIHSYPRSQGLSVIGGYVYRGIRLPELIGQYLFTDWQNGQIRALTPNGTNAAPVITIANTGIGFGPTAFGQDPNNGDLFMLRNNNAYRLVRNESSSTSQLPATLADTGAFRDLTTLTPNPGIEPFKVNVPFWSDHSIKSRWYSLPDTNLVYGFDAYDVWDFPASSVWIKHFDIDLELGNPATRRRLETRFIVKTTNSLYGATYRWDSATNATLVAENGESEELIRSIVGNIVTQRWDYPSRSACLSCHNASGGEALGFNTAQLNCDALVGSVITNQLIALSQRGYLNTNLTTHLDLPALAPADDTSASLTWRIRSYLHANCVQCHNGGNIANWDARLSTPMDDAVIINGFLNNNHGNPTNRVIAPNDLLHSELLQRLQVRGGGQMPPLASNLVDTQAVALVTAWIQSLAGWQDYNTWSTAELGSVQPKNDDFDSDGLNNFGEFLLQLDPDNPSETWTLSAPQTTNGTVELIFNNPAGLSLQIEWKSSLTDGQPWQLLQSDNNALTFPSSAQMKSIMDNTADAQRIYRARLIAP